LSDFLILRPHCASQIVPARGGEYLPPNLL
jgi:hypothetical protein